MVIIWHKFQASNSKKQTITKFKITITKTDYYSCFEFWLLIFGIYLRFDACDLLFVPDNHCISI